MARRKFSGFSRDEALQTLAIERLAAWEIEAAPTSVSPFFVERLHRLERFDLVGSESARLLIVDAFLEEALVRRPTLKIWKEAPLVSEVAIGIADYVVAPDRAYRAAPLFCVIEAKRDDFEKGAAQCLLAMDACAWANAQAKRSVTVFGVVTNGQGWRFYRRSLAGEYAESALYTVREGETLLGVLDYLLARCEENIG